MLHNKLNINSSKKKQSRKLPRFEYFINSGGEYQFVLKANNGKTIATGEAYASFQGMVVGIKAIRDCSVTASVIKKGNHLE